MDLTDTELEVKRIMEERWKLGREKYGEGLTFKNPEDIKHWVQASIEEVADLLQYLVCIKMNLDKR